MCKVAQPLLLGALLFCSLLADGQAKFFGKQSSSLTQEEVDSSLDVQLAFTPRAGSIQDALKPTYEALQQDIGGRLSHQAVRYLLHRFFVQEYGWYLKGLEPLGDTFSTGIAIPKTSDVGAGTADWVPSYLQGRIEAREGKSGLKLREIAVLAATMEDLVRKETENRLKGVYQMLVFPTTGTITHLDAEEAIDTYFMIYLLNRNITLTSKVDAEQRRERFASKYKRYGEAKAFLTELKHRHKFHLTGDVDFALMTRIAQDIGENYGRFNDIECSDLKKTLIEMEGPSRRAARVRLPDYFNHSFHTHWKFTEKPEFLRANGVLDESDEKQPAIIIPNYISSYPNCLKATPLYSVCCRNECEDLMKQLEQQIGSPTATADRVAELIKDLGTDTIQAPRTLSETLLHRLQQMADLHGGKVTLHGRLFAQWMHHAFPHECPYPHEAGSTNPQSADEWMQSTGHGDISMNEAERRKIVQDACDLDPSLDSQELPWTEVEELLVVQATVGITNQWLYSWLVLRCVALAGIAAILVANKLRMPARKEKQVLLVCLIIFVAYSLDLLEKFCFAFALLGALTLFLVGRKSDLSEKAAAFEPKCCV